MDKKQIAAVLKEMAVMMEIRGDNPFKVRAHQNAARIIEGLSVDLPALVKSGQLLEIKGIGKGMAEKISALLDQGELAEHQALKEAIPGGVLEMIKIPGLGPKKIKLLWQDMQITSIEDLEHACRAGKLAQMKGFGAKTEANILHNLQLLKQFRGRYLISEALEIAEALVQQLGEHPRVIRCRFAGSLRRGMETVKDIDLLASTPEGDRAAVMDYFAGLPGAAEVINKGEKKSTVRFANGLAAELRLVGDDQFAPALHHLTGAKEHNVAIRQRAIQRGMKVSEWGIYKGEERLPCPDEQTLFAHLGLSFIPPELRENRGQIEAAEAGQLPQLIELSDIRGMIHTHSVWSDGVNTIREMAEACRARGWKYLVVSDHSKAAAYANGLDEQRVGQQLEEIDQINRELAGFRVLKSIECDILGDGRLDFDDETLAGFELVIASIHSRFNMDEVQATERIITALKNPYVTILGHPTGRLLLSREGYPVNHEAVIDAAAELGVSIEINANPRRLDLDWRYVKYAADKNVAISICPDAHRISGLDDIRYGILMARKGWLTAKQVLNCYSAEELIRFAEKRRR